MGEDANRSPAAERDDPADLAAYARYCRVLAAAMEDALPRWVERCVSEVAARAGFEPTSQRRDAAARAGRRAAAEVAVQLDVLFATDIDAQATTPLELVRGAVRYPTEVLSSLGIEPVARDEFSRRRFPEDVYDLTPATFADLDPSLHDPGIAWGAAKAHLHLRRHRPS